MNLTPSPLRTTSTRTEAKHEIEFHIDNLNIYYSKRLAMRNISFDIHKNAITSIIGPSGCGKSSFIHTLNRINEHIPECTTEGAIYYQGKNILLEPFDTLELRRQIGIVFQTPSPFPFSIEKNFLIPLKSLGIKSKSECYDRMETSLKKVGLWNDVSHKLTHSALKLSGGQQQRLLIARVLSLGTKIILLDEPCSALDPISSNRIEQTLVELKEQYTIIIVTHNITQAKRISDYTALFWQQDNCGYLLEYGPSKAFFDSPQTALSRSYISGGIG